MTRTISAIVVALSVPGLLLADPPPIEPNLADDLQALKEEVRQLRQNQGEVDALRDEVRKLRGETDEVWLSGRRAEEVKSLVREVLADADTRASLLEGGMTAGHNGKKFFLASEDGSFLMNIEGQIQLRYIANFRSPDSTAGNSLDEGETGFQLRRTKMKFSGHIADPKLKFVYQFEMDRNSQQLFGDIITIGYDLTDTLYIWAGEDKAPFLREELTSSKRQLAVERSLMNEVFTLDVQQGIGAKWKAHDRIKFQGMFGDGGRSGDSGGNDRVLEGIGAQAGGAGLTDDPDDPGKDFQGDAVDWAMTGRVDVLLAGDWKQGADFTSWNGEDFFATVGAAVHYEKDETGDTTPNDALLMWTVDGSVEYNGWNAYAAFVMAHTDFELTAVEDNFDPWGLVVQGGYNIPLNGTSVEPFARYEHIDLDNAAVPSAGDPDAEDDFDLLTFGVNWYHKKHAAKFTADVVWALDPLRSDLKGLSDSLGLLPDDPNEEDQVVARLQYQLLF